MNPKVQKYFELLEKSEQGTATDAEKAMLESLRKELTTPPEPPAEMKTEKRFLPFKEASQLLKGEADSVKINPTPERAKLLKRNAEVLDGLQKAYGGQVPEEVKVPLEVMLPPDAPAVSTARLEKRIDDLTTLVQQLVTKSSEPAAPEGDSADEAELTAKQQGVALQLAGELLSGFAKRLIALKSKMDSGQSVTNDEVSEAFKGHWQIRDAVQMASVAMAKSETPPAEEDLKAAGDHIAKSVEDAVKEDDKGAADGGDGKGGDDKGDKGPDDGVNKDDTLGLLDLSPPLPQGGEGLE